MKPQIGVILIALIFGGALFVYSRSISQPSHPVSEEAGLEAQANVSEVLVESQEDVEIIVENTKSDVPNEELDVEMGSTTGLSEELQGFVEEFDLLTEELQSLESTSTETQ